MTRLTPSRKYGSNNAQRRALHWHATQRHVFERRAAACVY
jgi:hypothetical protein